jgi:hypothetical protein
MDFVLVARFILFLEVLACLWIARSAWQASDENDAFLFRLIGPLLGCTAAAILLYGVLVDL